MDILTVVYHLHVDEMNQKAFHDKRSPYKDPVKDSSVNVDCLTDDTFLVEIYVVLSLHYHHMPAVDW